MKKIMLLGLVFMLTGCETYNQMSEEERSYRMEQTMRAFQMFNAQQQQYRQQNQMQLQTPRTCDTRFIGGMYRTTCY